jgi:hypothetical protein
MKQAYQARSKIAHGGRASKLKRADGSEASLDDYVGIASEYVRDALKLLIGAAARAEQLPFGRWDELVLKRIAPETEPEAT